MADKAVGDGTGEGKMPPTTPGLSHLSGDETNQKSDQPGGHPKIEDHHTEAMSSGGGSMKK